MIDHGNARTKPFKYGHCVFNRNDMYVGRSLDLYGEFSDAETQLFKLLLKPGAQVVEVGANIGALTVPLAQIVGPEGAVMAFEPQRIPFQMLCANAAINGLENVSTARLCIGKESGGYIQVPELEQGIENNFGGMELEKYGNQYGGDDVPVAALDDLISGAVHFIKIDVEGMETAVIRGARQTIERCSPILYVENDRRDKSKELIELLWSLGYRLYWHMPMLFNPNNHNGNTENVFGDAASFNMLCLRNNVTVEGLIEVQSSDEFPIEEV